MQGALAHWWGPARLSRLAVPNSCALWQMTKINIMIRYGRHSSDDTSHPSKRPLSWTSCASLCCARDLPNDFVVELLDLSAQRLEVGYRDDRFGRLVRRRDLALFQRVGSQSEQTTKARLIRLCYQKGDALRSPRTTGPLHRDAERVLLHHIVRSSTDPRAAVIFNNGGMLTHRHAARPNCARQQGVKWAENIELVDVGYLIESLPGRRGKPRTSGFDGDELYNWLMKNVSTWPRCGRFDWRSAAAARHGGLTSSLPQSRPLFNGYFRSRSCAPARKRRCTRPADAS